MMRRRLLWLAALAVVVLVGLVFCFPGPRYAIWGLVRREPFYQGMPSCYWRESIPTRRYQATMLDSFRRHLGLAPPSRPVYLELLQGDPESLGVLKALLGDADEFMVGVTASNGIGNVAARARDFGEEVPELADAVPLLMQRLADGSPDRGQAIFALGQIGTPARAAIPLLERGLEDDIQFMRIMSAHALCRIDPHHQAGITVLVEGLRNPNPIRRVNGLDGLEAFRRLHGEVALQELRNRQEPVLAALRGARELGVPDPRRSNVAGAARIDALIREVEGPPKEAEVDSGPDKEEDKEQD